MASSGMLGRAALVRTNVSGALSYFETSVLTRATRRTIPEDDILHTNSRENLKFYNLKYRYYIELRLLIYS
jgi:hypothetical protein